MPTVFFTSDTHFGHLKALEFRPGLNSLEEHNEFIIDKWNSVVRPSDLVWHLGDVALGDKSFISCVGKCNGRKKLIHGKHDKYKIQEYLPYFKEIYGVVRAYHGMVLSHVPLHTQNLDFRWHSNIHGHIHTPEKYNLDERYFNVCTDVCDFRPVPLDTIKAALNIQLK